MARPTKWNNEIVRKLEEGFMAGLNVSQACFYAGISRDTYYVRLDEDVEFSDRMKQCKEALIIRSKLNIASAINDGDVNLSKWYVSKIKPQPEFSGNTTDELLSTASYDDNRRPIHVKNDTYSKAAISDAQDYAPYFCLAFVSKLIEGADSEDSQYNQEQKEAISDYIDQYEARSIVGSQVLSDAVAYFHLEQVDDIIINDQLANLSLAANWQPYIKSSSLLEVLFDKSDLYRLENTNKVAAAFAR